MDTKVNKKPIIITTVIVVFAVIALAIFLRPGDELSGTLNNQVSEIKDTQTDKAGKVDSVLYAFPDIPTKGKEIDVKFNAPDYMPEIVNNASSHIQGYARYRGEGYDYHIFPHSNLSGYSGGVFFVSDTDEFCIRITDPIEWTWGDNHEQFYYNHPTGLQIIGDTLVVSTIPAKGAWYNDLTFLGSAYTYIMDLTPLKASSPGAPKDVRKISEISGFKDINGNYTGSLSCVGVTDFNGRYLIGYISDDTLSIYQSNTETDTIRDATSFHLVSTYSLKYDGKENHYQSMGMFRDSAGEVYVIGLISRSGDDYCELFKLTEITTSTDTEMGELRLIENNSTLSPYQSLKTHMTLTGGAGFNHGGGIEVKDGRIIVYGSEAHADDGNATINMFDPLE